MEIKLKTDNRLQDSIELIKSVPALDTFEIGKTKVYKNYSEFDYESNAEIPMTEIKDVLMFRCLKEIFFDVHVDQRIVFTWGIATPESEDEKEILNECNDNERNFKSFFLPTEIKMEKGDALVLPEGAWFYFHAGEIRKMKGHIHY